MKSVNACVDQYIVGQKPRFAEEFRLGNVLTDPTNVKFIYQRPDQDDPIVLVYGVDAAVQRASTGKYHVDLSLDIEGEWLWRWESTGAVEAANQGKILVGAENPVG